MNIYVFENKTSTVSNELNSLSTNLAPLAHFKIATKEIPGFDINEESVDGVIIVLTKDSIEENAFISDIKKFIEEHNVEELRILLLENIKIKEIENKISIQNIDKNTIKYYGKHSTPSQLLNALQSFEKIEESKQQKVSTDIEHLIRTSHIDECLLIEKEWKTEYLPMVLHLDQKLFHLMVKFKILRI